MRRALLAACVVALTASASLAQGMRDRDRDSDRDEWRDHDRRVWQEDDDDHHQYPRQGWPRRRVLPEERRFLTGSALRSE